jgi:hypothetical protein
VRYDIVLRSKGCPELERYEKVEAEHEEHTKAAILHSLSTGRQLADDGADRGHF